ncbi:MAG: type VI secretion system contractile sheath small subunit [Gemmatimonas sp.]|nr:type VI secretion system contractile sheath small subunit [Gemmatimonas sp.]
MAESVNTKLERVRAPRVHIKYEVETGGAIEMKELPFVMGVLGNLTGHPSEPLAKLKERKFVEIDPDNFDEVLKSMKPHLSFKVENMLSDEPDAGQLAVDLNFQSMDDFSPEQVAAQVEPLRRLLELRQQLGDLRGSLQGNERLDDIIQATLASEESLDKLKVELSSEGEAEEGGDDE